MRVRWMAVVVALWLAGCMPMKPGASGGSTRTCMAENTTFLNVWSCVRARLVARQQDGTGSPRDGLIDEGDILADQVKAGKVSDVEARKRLDMGLAHDAS